MITGMQAAGKTTLGPLLAARLTPPAAAFDGDVFYHMVQVGHTIMTAERDPEAYRQVKLRYAAGALVAQHYLDNGFDFVYTDIILGCDIAEWLGAITGAERHLVVLNPSAETIAARETGRGKNSYRGWQKPGMTLKEAVESMQRDLEHTPRRGLWLDTSDMTAEQAVDAILADDMAASRY
jgi:hypothetical protein